MPSPSPDIKAWTLSPAIADLVVRDGTVQYRREEERRTKVAICGAGGTYDMPWDDPTFECWAMNNFWNMARDSEGRLAASRWWEQHQIFPDTHGAHRGKVIQNDQDMAWLRQCPVPIYTTEPFAANPLAVVWPVESFAQRYRDYFTCTFAIQIAQALDEGFAELHVYGLELLLGTKREATVESSCLNYWLGLAEGRGMRVVIADKTVRTYSAFEPSRPVMPRRAQEQFLLRHPFRYGHDYWQEATFVERYVARWDHLKTAV